ncbi:MAG: OPT/YSL family transporter, partial [Bacillota bacterium]
WPPGVATAEAIIAGDQGGKRARLLGYGVAGGVLGSYLGIPMSAFGVAFIGNIWALTMFGIGLLLRGYSISLFEIDINKLYIPHGIMIGAGLVALIQVTLVIFRKKKEEVARSESAAAKEYSFTRTEKDAQQTLVYGAAAYIIISVLIAFFGGIYAEMSLGMLLLYLIYAAFAAYVHEIIVGIAAMHSGWFPAFAVALITLVIGILIGFPPVALALLVGFSAATGPAFADMAYDLKTGYILRGYGKDTEFEMTGRRHQFYAELIGFAIAFVTVLLSYKLYFAQNLFPPVDRVYAATIKAGVSSDIARQLFLWAIPGAIIQLLGGPERQMGVLLATGLLILNPKAGWAVLTAILIRTIILKVKGKEAETPMSIVAAGIIAGDALYSFFSSLYKYKKL